MLTWDNSTLCKPLVPRELLFYLNVPKELVKFVPSYKGVVQIRETGSGNYPPLVYQPLRSPKSPYAKFATGISNTLPARFGARPSGFLSTSPRPTRNNSTKAQQSSSPPQLHHDGAHFLKSVGRNSRLGPTSEITKTKSASTIDQITVNETHSSNNQQLSHQSHNQQHITNCQSKHPAFQFRYHDQIQATQDIERTMIETGKNDNLKVKEKILAMSAADNSEIHRPYIGSIDEHIIDNHMPVARRHMRSNSEDNSNASSEPSGEDYYSEDSNQSIMDVCGSPLELKVQIRQCSDEKLLKKNLSQDNLLAADYISRPNDKCKYMNISQNPIFLNFCMLKLTQLH